MLFTELIYSALLRIYFQCRIFPLDLWSLDTSRTFPLGFAASSSDSESEEHFNFQR